MPVPGHDVEAYCLLCECKYEERSTTTIKVPGRPAPRPASRPAPPLALQGCGLYSPALLHRPTPLLVAMGLAHRLAWTPTGIPFPPPVGAALP